MNQEQQYLNPAEYLIHVVGGLRKTARLIGRTAPTIHYWKKRGSIPPNAQREILGLARQNSLDLTAEDLINGRHVNLRAQGG